MPVHIYPCSTMCSCLHCQLVLAGVCAWHVGGGVSTSKGSGVSGGSAGGQWQTAAATVAILAVVAAAVASEVTLTVVAVSVGSCSMCVTHSYMRIACFESDARCRCILCIGVTWPCMLCSIFTRSQPSLGLRTTSGRIIVTHGTDTMIETAKYVLASGATADKAVAFTGDFPDWSPHAPPHSLHPSQNQAREPLRPDPSPWEQGGIPREGSCVTSLGGIPTFPGPSISHRVPFRPALLLPYRSHEARALQGL